jgi:hypothetical protein
VKFVRAQADIAAALSLGQFPAPPACGDCVYSFAARRSAMSVAKSISDPGNAHLAIAADERRSGQFSITKPLAPLSV